MNEENWNLWWAYLFKYVKQKCLHCVCQKCKVLICNYQFKKHFVFIVEFGTKSALVSASLVQMLQNLECAVSVKGA